jgi:DHA3 family macrolide efflux protein-like MFS transporter
MNNWKKNISLFMTGQTISLFGSMLVQYAITWHITLSTQSGVMLTISILCGFLPNFFILPFAGVWADRYNRKMLIIISDSMIALSTLVLAIIFLMGYNMIWLLFVISVFRSFGSGIQSPAVSAYIPHLIPTDKLTKVNSINTSIQSLIMLVSPIISALLISITTIEMIFFIDVVTAIIAITILLLFMYEPKVDKLINKERPKYFNDLSKGFKYIINHKFIRNFIMINAIFLLFVAPVAFLTPLDVTRKFGDNVLYLTLIEICFSVGMMIGGIVMSIWGGFKNRTHSMVISNLIIAFSTITLGFVPFLWMYLALMVVIGLALPAFNIPATVLIQEKVEKEYLGRVFGVFGMVSSIMMPLGMLVFGPIADYVKIEYLLIGTGIVMFIVSIIMVSNKVILEAGRPLMKPELIEQIID